MKLAYELRQELLEGNLVLFLGAGFTKNFLPAMPTWEELLKQAYSHFTGSPDDIFSYFRPTVDAATGNKTLAPSEYLRAAQVFELTREQKNKNAAGANIIPSIHSIVQNEILRSYDVDLAKGSIAGKFVERAKDLPLLNWVTTNFDTFIEDAVLSSHFENRTASVLSRPIRTRDFRDLSASRTLFKIHGSVDDPSPERSIVITEDDYYRFTKEDKYLTHKLFVLFCEKTIVFVGYSLSDPNIQSIYTDVLFEQKGSTHDDHAVKSFAHIRPAFFISPRPVDDSIRAYYRHKKIEYIENYSIEELFHDLWEVFERNRERVASVTDRVTALTDRFKQLVTKLSSLPWDGFLPWDNEYMSVAEQLMDLLEFYDVSSRPSQPVVASLGISDTTFVTAVQLAVSTLRTWNAILVPQKNIDLCDLILQRLEKGFMNRKTFSCKNLVRTVEDGLLSLAALDIEAYVTRYMKLLFQYDGRYSDWGDYVYVLERYIVTSALYKRMNVPTRKHYIDRFYEQLKRCGRQAGDSWYSVEAVYQLWHRLSVDCWPQLEARIQRAGTVTGNKVFFPGYEQEMLNHLRPGADFRKFLPRS